MRLGAIFLHLCVTELRILRVFPTVEKVAQLVAILLFRLLLGGGSAIIRLVSRKANLGT